ncbi:MAG: RNA polymerase sigma factor SigJ [Myxococcales bacterium]|nr:RNA polymerase sigma factor SigJ [Myxococcales bacterium]
MTPAWTESFEAERPRLFAVAYRMLGSAAEAEDVLQEAWLRGRTIADAPQSPRAMWTTIVVRLAIDAATSARARRESYVGPWLPEPITTNEAPSETPDDRIDMLESISIALLLVLETLSPLERAVFLLREVFDYEFADIGECLGRNEAACRQLFHRAKTHVSAKRRRFEPDGDETRKVVAAFVTAVLTGDTESVAATLRDDAIATSDGGGKAKAALKTVVGRDRVAAFSVGLAKRGGADVETFFTTINGQPALVAHIGLRIVTVVVYAIEQGRIASMFMILNPDKLERLAHRLLPARVARS